MSGLDPDYIRAEWYPDEDGLTDDQAVQPVCDSLRVIAVRCERESLFAAALRRCADRMEAKMLLGPEAASRAFRSSRGQQCAGKTKKGRALPAAGPLRQLLQGQRGRGARLAAAKQSYVAVMALLLAFAAGVLVGFTLSERRFEAMVRRACAAIDLREGSEVMR